MSKVWLSVDFDYFSRELMEWDWGHSEETPYTDLLWYSRSECLEGTSLEHANPHPEVFWSKLVELGFDFSECEVFAVADSHKWAAKTFLELPKANHIINFDAHHDMGYQPWEDLKAMWLDKKKADCSNWLALLLNEVKRLRATVVYPQWKGEQEITNGSNYWEEGHLKERFDFMVYREEQVSYLAEEGKVAGVFISKSSSWTPPWHDEAFNHFVYEGATVAGLDVQVPFELEERCHPLEARRFDMEAALKFRAEMERMRGEILRISTRSK